MTDKEITGADILDLAWKTEIGDDSILAGVLDFIYGDTFYERLEEALDAASREDRKQLYEAIIRGRENEAPLREPTSAGH